MTYPTQPDDTVIPSWIGMDCSYAEHPGTPVTYYMYAIVPYIRIPGAWRSTSVERNQIWSVSRAVTVDSGSYYDDIITWVNATGSDYWLFTTGNIADITDTTAWTDRQESNENHPTLMLPWGEPGSEFGVLEIAVWNDTEEASGSVVAAFSVDTRNELDYDEPGASDVRQHIERVGDEAMEPGQFASAYHAMWCVSESVNRSLYEDRHSNTWPIFSREEPPS